MLDKIRKKFISWADLMVIPLCIHRGQESAGIVTSDGSSVPAFKVHKVNLNIKKL
jgi:glutamine phosphoribosylpyrophosphate amidotransferase